MLWKYLSFAGIALAMATAPALSQVKIALDSPADLENSGSYNWAHTFAEYLNANGIQTEEFARGALGEEAERLDQVSAGLLEISMSDVKSAGTLDPLIFGVALPFLFESAEELDKAVEEGGLLEKVNEGTTPKGVRVLAFTLIGRPAGIFNTQHPVATVSDMADLRMRALDQNQIKMFEAWKSAGTVVSWAEVPNALQTGVADGYINAPFVPLIFGHTDFLKYFADLKIVPSARIAIASEDWYQSLTDEERVVVDEGVRQATAANRKWLEGRNTVLDALQAAGVEVVQPTAEARAEFEELSRALYSNGILTPEQVSIWVNAAERK